MNREITLLTLDVMLGMFQRSSLYDKIIDYFHRNEKIVYFLQQSYLLHETFDEITETSTLILSRMALSTTDQPLHLQKPFLNAIKIRMKILDTHQLLYNNIKSIIGWFAIHHYSRDDCLLHLLRYCLAKSPVNHYKNILI